MSENHESTEPNNSESSVNQEEGAAVRIYHAESKDDLFVDAPDELTYEARNADNRESVASNETETSVSEEKRDIMRENHFVENDNGGRDNHILVDELERLRNLLDKTVNEKDSIEKEYKEERETFSRQLVYLSHQLKVLSDKELLLGENDGGSVDTLIIQKSAQSEGASQGGGPQLHELLSECSVFLRSAKEERLQSESVIGELKAIIHKKDQEIEDLNAKVTELSVSHDVATSYLNSVAGIASEGQLEKDQYVGVVADRMSSYLAMVVNPEELLDNSIIGKISHVERSTYQLIEKYNHMLYEIYQLGQCLSKAEPELRIQEEFGKVFAVARDELLELKARETELVEKVRHLEDENRRVVERVQKEKETVEALNAELSSMKTEVEQEKTRCANTREKLSLAVTKGKALVQQRDSLKQLLAEKTTELEKCQAELQEKSSALEAAELSREQLVKTENFIASLQETISERNSTLEKFEEILSQTDVPEEFQSTGLIERVKWVVNDRNELKVASSDYNNLKDAISLIDLPETASFTDLESRLSWLKKSFNQAKDEADHLLDELTRTKEVARVDIDRLSASLSAELQEKDYFQKELDDLGCQYREIVEKADEVSSEKDQIIRTLLEESGIAIEDVVTGTSADPTLLIHRCLEKIKEQSLATSDALSVDPDIFERMETILYVKNHELALYEQLLEEDMQARFQLNDLSNELREASEELCALKEEKDSLLKDLERSEEKSAILREKLSMAVKKGKGLVQDRENLKSQLDDKDSEIEKLMLKLQHQESTVSDLRDQVSKLSTDLERISVLEADVLSLTDQRDQLQQFLSERNNVLQRVIESVDHIILPVDTVFEEPVEKLKWIAGYINESQDAKRHLEQELGKRKEEASSLASELASAQTTMKSLEEALSAAEDKFTQLAEEKRAIEVHKETAEEELEKAIEEARIQTSKFSDACASRKSLEDELSMKENTISVLISEKEEAQVSKDTAVMELQKVREEVAFQTNKLTESYKMIKSLEEALSQAENNVVLLTEQSNVVEVGRTTLENELQNLKDEVESKTVHLGNTEATIKSLEDALLKAENNTSELEGEKRIAEQEISTLDSKLKACMEELAGTSSSLQSRSVELAGTLNDLQMFLKDEGLLSLVKQCFEKKFQDLKNMDLIVKDIINLVADKDSELLLHQSDMEGSLHVSEILGGDVNNIEIENLEVNVGQSDDISSRFMKTAEGFHVRNKMLNGKLEGLSSSVDEFIAALLRKLQKTRDEVIKFSQSMESLKQKVTNLEVEKQERDEAMEILESDVTTLLSICSDATRELQFDFKNHLLNLNSVPELEKLRNGFIDKEREVDRNVSAEHQKRLYNNKYAEAAENLLFSTSKAQSLSKLFESTTIIAASAIQDLQKRLQEATILSQKATEERDLLQNRVFELENNLKTLQDSYGEMEFKVEDFQAKEEKLEGKLKEKESEISSLYSSLSKKERDTEDYLLSASQMRTLIHKVHDTDIPFAESEKEDLAPESSADVKKLFYIVNSVTELQQQIDALALEKQELLSTLLMKTAEIKNLKEEVETNINHEPELEKIKMEVSEHTFRLQKIINMLGGNDSIVDQKSASLVDMLLLLEKQVITLLSDAENSKFKVEELDSKLKVSQEFVDELTTKIRLLENSVQTRTAKPEIVQERSIFEAPTLPTESEISEVEDVELVAKKSVSPVQSAAQMRTLRKGSTEHLAINIDSESTRLIDKEETDEDKGHVFKSLNTTGLIPKQGKMIADRVDGIWVTGGRVLMSRPGARLGLIAYWIFMHMWLLGTIL